MRRTFKIIFYVSISIAGVFVSLKLTAPQLVFEDRIEIGVVETDTQYPLLLQISNMGVRSEFVEILGDCSCITNISGTIEKNKTADFSLFFRTPHSEGPFKETVFLRTRGQSFPIDIAGEVDDSVSIQPKYWPLFPDPIGKPDLKKEFTTSWSKRWGELKSISAHSSFGFVSAEIQVTDDQDGLLSVELDKGFPNGEVNIPISVILEFQDEKLEKTLYVSGVVFTQISADPSVFLLDKDTQHTHFSVKVSKDLDESSRIRIVGENGETNIESFSNSHGVLTVDVPKSLEGISLQDHMLLIECETLGSAMLSVPFLGG